MKLTIVDLGLIAARERRSLRLGIEPSGGCKSCRLVARESGHTWIVEAEDEDAASRLLAQRLGLATDALLRDCGAAAEEAGPDARRPATWRCIRPGPPA